MISEYPLKSLYFYLTEGCNLCCRHCWINPKYQSQNKIFPSLDIGLFHSIIEQAKPLGLSAVKLTGGEPLLHPDISEILDTVRCNDLNLAVETNGTLCTRELAQKIASCKSPIVSVSLDGSDAGTHEWVRGVEGCFEAALEGIRNLVAVGFRPQIIMTIMKNNVHQMESVIRLAESLGAGSVKYNIVQPIGRGEALHEKTETLDIEELVEIGRWVENKLSRSTDLYVTYSHPMAFKPFGKMLGNDRRDGCKSCNIYNILGVLSDGSYALCGIGVTIPELIFGHADKDSLEEVWTNTTILNDIRRGLPEQLEGICSDCVLKRSCLGHCLAMNYETGNSLWTPFWYCDMARKAGLFPDSRSHSSLLS